MNFEAGNKVQYGNGAGMIIGTVREIYDPVAPHFVQWVSLENVVKKNGEPSKKYEKGITVNAKDIKVYQNETEMGGKENV